MRIRTIHDITSLSRGRRLDHGWTQAEVARRARVSRKWVSDFENGKATVELGAVLRVLDVLGVELRTSGLEAAGSTTPADGFDLDRHLDKYLNR